MLLISLGIFHIIHGPFLIIYPFTISNDILYLQYFFIMIYLYTFCNRECPITYIAKQISNLSHEKYPEMVVIGITDKTSDIFFMTTTVGYIGSLIYVLYRLSYFTVLLPIHLLPIYFICPKDDSIFIPVQGLTQLIIVFSFLDLVVEQISRDW